MELPDLAFYILVIIQIALLVYLLIGSGFMFFGGSWDDDKEKVRRVFLWPKIVIDWISKK